jgi:hypothetical protein
MKLHLKKCLYLTCLLLCTTYCSDTKAQQKVQAQNISTWQTGSLLNHYRPLQPAIGSKIERIDLDGDGDPDILKYKAANGFNVLWIDDDDDMKWTDTEGDTDSDCLMVDMNNDGRYGSYTDVIIDWVDTDGDGKANFQIYVDFASETDSKKPWGPGHFMVNIDADKDDIMNYVDFSNFQLRCWIHDGKSDFYEDYHGNTLFLKIHASPQNINDLRLNWENPFLFYDPDKDGLTEYAVRLLDRPTYGKPGDKFITNLTGKIDYVTMSYDLDNDNSPGSPFDFDMTINFRGGGFDYTDQVHKFTNQRIVETDTMFLDPRFRQLTEFIYPDHKSALPSVFKSNWEQAWFVYDEDDDCDRWERVEMLDPLDPYIIGVGKGGLDTNNQSDPVGDRGEWDLDFSGKGNLYISPIDGKIHLLGAEKGYWRVDQNAWYYQGMGGLYDGYGPTRTPIDPKNFTLISYLDTDSNGFFDHISFDLDGDKTNDFSFSLKELGISDVCKVYDISKMKYADFRKMKSKIASDTWKSALEFVKLAEGQGINTQWYAFLKHPKSIRQQYSQGYWLKFYLFMDMLEKANSEQNFLLAEEIIKKYFGQNKK